MAESLTMQEAHEGIYEKYPDYISATEKLAYYEDLKGQGRLVILPKGMTLRKLLEILDGNSSSCPSEYNLINRCELSCFECWLAALKGAEQ